MASYTTQDLLGLLKGIQGENEVKDITHLKRPYSPIEEKQSAKEPDIRPKFRQMLEDIKKGKYDGIIAWHPDRLARNVSFTFENSTAGKMLLGISFVLSKQYSDKLSDDLTVSIMYYLKRLGSYGLKGKHKRK